MDVRRSFYVTVKQDEFTEPAPNASRLDCDGIPYITAANDNVRVRDRLRARCEGFFHRLIELHRQTTGS
jgi:hypothetical protein